MLDLFDRFELCVCSTISSWVCLELLNIYDGNALLAMEALLLDRNDWLIIADCATF